MTERTLLICHFGMLKLSFFIKTTSTPTWAIGLTALMVTALLVQGCDRRNQKPVNDEQKAGYAIGVNLAENLKRQNVKVDSESVQSAIRDVLSDRPLKMTPDERQAAIDQLQTAARAEQQKRAEAEMERSKAFLAENAKKPGVIQRPSGLQIQVLRAGAGRTPGEKSEVSLHYTGTLADGRTFDSSVERGSPAQIQMAETIPGWREALSQMKVGTRARIVIPPSLAYGPQGREPVIPGNAVLVFDVDLLDAKN